MSNEEKKPLNGTALNLYFEDELEFEMRMARKLLSPEELEEIKAMMRPTMMESRVPRKIICFGTGSK